MNKQIVLPIRPRRLRRTLALAGAGGMLAAGVTTAGLVRAETATMAGTLGIAPNYASVGLCPCTPLRHSVMPTQRGLANMVAAIDKWVTSPAPTALPAPESKRLVTFSATTQAATGWVRDHAAEPITRAVEIIAMGSSETPGNGWSGRGHRDQEGLPTDQGAVFDNVTFVVRQYDPVADKATNPNFWSRINEKLSTHVNGYDDIDLDNPDVTYVDPVTGSTTKYYRSDVLPMLRWRAGFTSDERMAELDAKYRPRIDAAYDRPWEASSATNTSADIEPTRSPTTSRSTTSRAITRTETSSRRPATSDTSGSEADTKPAKSGSGRGTDSSSSSPSSDSDGSGAA